MCGITGFWDFKASLTAKTANDLGKAMGEAIQSRGPDSWGVWVQEEMGLLFSHRRLAIQDLSAEGHQPMHATSGRFTTIYNGEIYNGPDLQKELMKKGYTFRGHSDTEVMLVAFEEWGIELSLQKFLGMFAIALWDHKEKKLYLIRDRLGKKPLYWGWQKDVLLFGSQLKSFYLHPSWEGGLSKEALTSFFRFGYVPTPLSIYAGIYKLEPGTFLEITRDRAVQKKVYWSLEDICRKGHHAPFEGSLEDATNVLEDLLKDAVQKRLLSDVPVGAFLSGGIDSSTVVALMQQQSKEKVKTFSIGFQKSSYDEAPYAKSIAEYLGTEHHELYVTSKEAQEVIPHLPGWYDEPFADSSQIPTYLVSKLARKFVTVSLSGDGGDEVFAGYTRYFLGDRLWKGMSCLPPFSRHGIGNILKLIPSSMWRFFEGDFFKGWVPSHLEDKVLKTSRLLSASTLEEFYKGLVSQWQTPTLLVKGGRESLSLWWDQLKKNEFSSIETMQFLDTLTYLPDDIFTKVDRASMALGLEARVPLVDHRLVEFAWKLPLEMKVHQGKGKRILREVLQRYVPEHLFARPKMGFGIPIGDWIRGDLKDWAESLLSKSALESSGLLQSTPILEAWKDHKLQGADRQYELWTILMFQAWMEKTKGNI